MARDETSRPPRKTDRARRSQDAPTGHAPLGERRTTQRVAKAMARAGLCSRRDAEAWIAQGRVSVNGHVLTSPALDVGPNDLVLVDGAPLPAPEKTRLFLFHKPRGLVTSDHDPEGRATVADFLRDNWPDAPRVVTIGRLDINTEGLLLLTNDGGLARALELPSTGWLRRYRVRAKGTTDQAVLDRLADGVTIEGIDYLGIEAKLDRAQGSNCWLTMGLREGKNREIKRVLEHIGLEVNRLIRLSFGPFQLLDLPEGAVEEVRTRVLRDQLGEALIRAAGVDLGESEPTRGAPRMRIERPEHPEERPMRDRRSRVEERAPPTRAPDDETRATGRRHVSTLRAQSREAAHTGPRRRIERAETTDPNDRTIKVERLVTARPANAREEQRPTERSRGKPRADTRARDGERQARGPRRDHASPSALGKRERIARSGGASRHENARGESRPRRGDERAPRSDRAGRPDRTPRPDRGPRPDRASGRDRTERPDRSPRQDRGPWQERGPRDERGPRQERGPCQERGPRQERTGRDDKSRQDRAPRGDRPLRQDRGEKRERSGIPERGSRRFDGDRPPRRREETERPRRDGPPRSSRGDRDGGLRSPRQPEERPDRDGRRAPPRAAGRDDAGRPRGPAGGKPGPRGPRSGGGGTPRPRPSKPKR